MTAESPNATASADSRRRITPEDLKPGPVVATPPGIFRRLVWPAFAGLLLLAALVFVELPAWVAEAERETLPAASPAADSRLNLRQQARQMLDELTVQWNMLVAQQVEQWPGVDLGRMPELLEQAGLLFRQQNYQQSLDNLAQVASRVEQLQKMLPEALAKMLALGDQALQARAPEQARHWFSMALLLEPEGDAAVRGMEAAKRIEQTNRLMSQGQAAEHSGEIAAALDFYQQAVALDKVYEPALQARDRLQARLDDARFRGLLTQGFRQLDSGNAQQAMASFRKAAAIRPGSAEANSALQQAQSVVRQEQIKQIGGRARDAGSRQQWQQALEYYQQVLKLDAGLSFALEGKAVAEQQLKIDRQLEQILQQKNRLQSEAARQNARQWLSEARSKGQGEQIRNKLEELARLLELAEKKIPVTLLSDGKTEVIILRVGQLGRFEKRQLTLQTGKYVLKGSRSGYRDVQLGLAVTGEQDSMVLRVQCEEQI